MKLYACFSMSVLIGFCYLLAVRSSPTFHFIFGPNSHFILFEILQAKSKCYKWCYIKWFWFLFWQILLEFLLFFVIICFMPTNILLVEAPLFKDYPGVYTLFYSSVSWGMNHLRRINHTGLPLYALLMDMRVWYDIKQFIYCVQSQAVSIIWFTILLKLFVTCQYSNLILKAVSCM